MGADLTSECFLRGLDVMSSCSCMLILLRIQLHQPPTLALASLPQPYMPAGVLTQETSSIWAPAAAPLPPKQAAHNAYMQHHSIWDAQEGNP